MKIYNLLFEGREQVIKGKAIETLIDEHGMEEEEAEYHANYLYDKDQTAGKVNVSWVLEWALDSDDFSSLIEFANEYADTMTRKKKDPKIPTESTPEEALRSLRVENEKRIKDIEVKSNAVSNIEPQDIIYNSETFLIAKPSNYETSMVLGELCNKTTCISTSKTRKYWDMFDSNVDIYFIVNKLTGKRNPKSLIIVGVFTDLVSSYLRGMEGDDEKIYSMIRQGKQRYDSMETEWSEMEEREFRPFNLSEDEMYEVVIDSINSRGNIKEAFNTNNERLSVVDAEKSLLSYAIYPEDMKAIKSIFSK